MCSARVSVSSEHDEVGRLEEVVEGCGAHRWRAEVEDQTLSSFCEG